MYHTVLIQKTSCIIWNVILGNEYFVVDANGNQPSIKHPVHGPGKS